MSVITTILLIIAIVILIESIVQFFSVRKSLKDTLNVDASSVKLYGTLYFVLLFFFLVTYIIFTMDWIVKPEHDSMHVMIMLLLFFGSVFVGISTMFLRKFIESVLGIRLDRVDTMTGLMTKGGLEIVGNKLLKGSDQNVLAIMDLDNFKQINDSYGHTIGDEIIKELAQILRDAVRDGDTIGRFGGDEFVVILHSLTVEDGKTVMERVQQSVNKAMETHRYDIQTGVSVGLTEMNGGSSKTYQQVFDTADAALYEAKDRGGNCIVVK